MALFSTLLSPSSEPSTTKSASSSEIPTLIQLFTTKSLTFDPNAQLDEHAVLAYQALYAKEASSSSVSLFGTGRRNRKNRPKVTPNANLGVWNCCTAKSSGSQLVDSLLMVPENRSHFYCMTVDLSDPTMVEPSISLIHAALVRLLIHQPPPTTTNSTMMDPMQEPTTALTTTTTSTTATTSVAQLKKVQFGLAPEDASSSSSSTQTNDGTEQQQYQFISLLICAVMGPSTKDNYKETQAQNLILYHLRRYAAALNCSLMFVGTTDMEGVPTVSLDHVPQSWREWMIGTSTALTNKTTTNTDNVVDPTSEPTAAAPDATPPTTTMQHFFFLPDSHQPELIESVLLRNAQCAGEWDASKDSLWKALPPSKEMEEKLTGLPSSKSSGGISKGAGSSNKLSQKVGDDGWLSELRDSVAGDSGSTTAAASSGGGGGANAASSGSASSTNNATAATGGGAVAPKTEDAAVSSFFENLLKK